MADQDEQAQKMMEEQAKKWGSVIARCWSDEAFKKKFMADPAATLKAEGVNVDLPAGTTMKAVENTDAVYHFVIPAKPDELSEEALDMVAGGAIAFTYQKCGFCQGTTPACVSTPVCGCGCVWTLGGCGCAQPIPSKKQ